MANLKAIIIEDEINSRQLLRSILENFTPDVEIINEAHSIKSGLIAIESTPPDIVFLDIELTDGTGFELLEAYGPINFHLIFVTAYNQHALKAFKYSAFDYLLKPIDIDSLEECIARLKMKKKQEKRNIKFLKSILNTKDIQVNKISISFEEGQKLLYFEEVVAIKGTKNNVRFIMEDGTIHLVTKTLGYYEDILPITTFYRIHKSHFINLDKITEIKPGRISQVVMTDRSQYDIAARRKTSFLNFLKSRNNSMLLHKS